MTPAQIERASDLLIERGEIVDTISRIREIKRFKIEASKTLKGETPDRDHEYFHSIGDAMDMTPEVRKLLLTAPQAKLAAIDKELTALGVDLTEKGAADAVA